MGGEVPVAPGGLVALHSRVFRGPGSAPAAAAKSVKRGGTGAASHTAHLRRGPAATVHAYFTALNAHDYARAWALGGRYTGSSYTSYVDGFGTTARNTVTIVSVSGHVVTARRSELQTDGTVKTFQGNYTVHDGVITQFSVQPVG